MRKRDLIPFRAQVNPAEHHLIFSHLGATRPGLVRRVLGASD